LIFAAGSVAVAQSARRIEVSPICGITGDTLMAHTAIDIESQGKVAGQAPTRAKYRDLWSLVCSVSKRSCRAAVLHLEDLERGEAVGPFDLELPTDLTVVASSSQVFTLKWGPWRTITVDLSRSRVEYRLSHPEEEAEGLGSCK
jgi:hypothetical protein